MNVHDIEFTAYAKFHLEHKGVQFLNAGRPVPKFVAWLRIKQHRDKFLTKTTKPGWHDGAIINKGAADQYLNEIQY